MSPKLQPLGRPSSAHLQAPRAAQPPRVFPVVLQGLAKWSLGSNAAVFPIRPFLLPHLPSRSLHFIDKVSLGTMPLSCLSGS